MFIRYASQKDLIVPANTFSLDYLLEHREQYAEQIKSFMKGLKKREPKEFVNNYLIRDVDLF